MKPTILITGASSGIGRAAAIAFAARGYNVVATMRRPEDGAELARDHGVRVTRLDVTDPASITAAMAETERAFGRIDVLLNNAGYGLFGPFETATPEMIDRQIATNLTGVFNVTRAVLPGMRDRRAGTIITIASIGGLVAFPLNSLYNATKFALVGFSESLAHELAPFGIKVRVICPGGVATDFAGRSLAMTFSDPANPYADTIAKVAAAFRDPARQANYSSAESIADAIVFAAEDPGAKVTRVAGADAEALAKARHDLGPISFATLMATRMGLNI